MSDTVIVINNRKSFIAFASQKVGEKNIVISPGSNPMTKDSFDKLMKNEVQFSKRINKGELKLIMPKAIEVDEIVKESKAKIKKAAAKKAESKDVSVQDEAQKEIDDAKKEQEEAELISKRLEEVRAENIKAGSCGDFSGIERLEDVYEVIMNTADIKVLRAWKEQEKRTDILNKINDQIEKITPKK